MLHLRIADTFSEQRLNDMLLAFTGCVTPPGTFFHLKMFMLMCLVLLHGSESTEDHKQAHSKNLYLLIISEDLLRIQRLLLYGASFARRMIVYSPISELFASCSRDPFGTGTCMINGKRATHFHDCKPLSFLQIIP